MYYNVQLLVLQVTLDIGGLTTTMISIKCGCFIIK